MGSSVSPIVSNLLIGKGRHALVYANYIQPVYVDDTRVQIKAQEVETVITNISVFNINIRFTQKGVIGYLNCGIHIEEDIKFKTIQ